MTEAEKKNRQLFKNNSDCYADTGRFYNDGSYSEGEVIQAMTEDRFIQVLDEQIKKALEEARPNFIKAIKTTISKTNLPNNDNGVNLEKICEDFALLAFDELVINKLRQ